jgi:hypothetical protein
MIANIIFLLIAIFAVLKIAAVLDKHFEQKQQSEINKRFFKHRKF